tara:strand:+ start:1726 stop:1977 length:252 start_codon:yes stop_codon:yes gene_type:complete
MQLIDLLIQPYDRESDMPQQQSRQESENAATEQTTDTPQRPLKTVETVDADAVYAHNRKSMDFISALTEVSHKHSHQRPKTKE